MPGIGMITYFHRTTEHLGSEVFTNSLWFIIEKTVFFVLFSGKI